eukprot:4296247-Pyramimonas_sp.AAC.1
MMRPIRRIAGEVRFGKVDHTDVQLRAKMYLPSVDDLLCCSEPVCYTCIVFSRRARRNCWRCCTFARRASPCRGPN